MSEGYFQAARGSGTFVCLELPEPPESSGAAGVLGSPASAPPVDAGHARQAFLRSVRNCARTRRRRRKSEGYINLTPAGQDMALFPLDLWRRLYVSSLKRIGTDALDYAEHGAGLSAAAGGDREIRSALREAFLLGGRGRDRQRLATGSGFVRAALPGADRRSGDREPGLRRCAPRCFEACGARLRPVRVDEEGLVCSELGDAARLVYVTPARQFPVGVALSRATEARRFLPGLANIVP